MHLPNNALLQGGKYKIIRFIASGGFGCTYEGIHTMLDTKVAIKEFFPKMFCNRDENTSHVTVATQGNRDLVAKLRKKFNEEAIAVFRMKHDNIVRVLDVFEENGTAYYVMEYVDGKSLYEIVKERGALPEAEAVGYIRQIAEALKYVHSLNRLHLDIKPGNIMVDKNGKAILVDFGSSKHYDDESGENTSTLLGVNTKGYAPIEQSTQRFSSFSPATDIYALGATLYKLLTGITPPDANLLVIEEKTLKPLALNISQNVRNATEMAMQLLRKNRPQNIDEFLVLLNSTDDDYEATALDAPITIRPNIVTKASLTGIENGHEWVDLGLPSGLKWATCNIGASKPEELGDRFAWGETRTKSEYTKSNSETYEKGWDFITHNGIKWLRENGYIDNKNNLTGIHDAAACNWGGKWRMPTKEDIGELVENCEWEYIDLDEKKGFLCTGPNGNCIFFPLDCPFEDYWCSTADDDNSGAWSLCLYVHYTSIHHSVSIHSRYNGEPIRPVTY